MVVNKKHSFFSVTGLNVIAKILNLFSIILIAKYLPSKKVTDDYFYYFSSVMLLATFINSIDINFFIPKYSKFYTENKAKEAIEQLSSCLFIYCVIIVLLFSLVIVSSLFSEYSHFITIFSVFFYFSILIIHNYFSNILQNESDFLFVGSMSIIYSVATFLFINFFSSEISVVVLFNLQSITYLMILVSFLIRSTILRDIFFTFNYEDVTLIIKRDFKSIIYLQIGNAAAFFYGFLNLIIVKSLGQGVITAYNFSMQFLSLPSNIIVGQVGLYASSVFNMTAKSEDKFDDTNKITKIIKLGLSIILPITLFLYFTSFSFIELVAKFLKLNEAFTTNSAYFLKFLSLALPFILINTIITRYLFSKLIVKSSVLVQVLYNFILLGFTYFFSFHYSIDGFLAVYVIVPCIYVFFFLPFYLKKLSLDVDLRPTFFYMILLLSVAFSIFFILSKLLAGYSPLYDVLIFFFFSVIFFFIIRIMSTKLNNSICYDFFRKN